MNFRFQRPVRFIYCIIVERKSFDKNPLKHMMDPDITII